MKVLDSIVNKYNSKVEGNPAAKQTVVFAHGFGTDQTSLRFLRESFQANYPLVLYDNVGRRRSDLAAFSPVKYQDLNSYTSDLLEIAEVLQLGKAVALSVAIIIFESDCRAKLPELKKDGNIIQMKKDVAVTDNVGRYLHAHIEKRPLLEIDVEAHFAQLSAPEMLSKSIQPYLS